MEFYNGRFCISYPELIDGGIVTKTNYDNWTKRNKVTVARRGGRGGLCSYCR